MCSIVVIKYIRMLPKSDQMFQKAFLYGIEADSIAQSLWSGVDWIEKKLNWPQSWYTYIVIGCLVTHHDTIF
jgi:hypothetical protein